MCIRESAGVDATTGKSRIACGWYTQAQIRDIVAYSAGRQISVVPEIDAVSYTHLWNKAASRTVPRTHWRGS